MRVGVPKEVKSDEYRVAMMPVGVEQLVRSGHEVTVEANAVESLRMDLLTLDSNANRLVVPPGGTTGLLSKTGTYTIVGNGIDTGSRLMYNEAFA